MTIGEAQKMLIAIHKHCFECSGRSRDSVHNCEIKTCTLYPYREPERAQEATPDPYGNYPYGGRRPVKVLKTRIHAEWEEQNRTKYIWDY